MLENLASLWIVCSIISTTSFWMTKDLLTHELNKTEIIKALIEHIVLGPIALGIILAAIAVKD